MEDDNFTQDGHLHDDNDDRQINLFLFAFFWVVTCIITFGFSLSDNPLVNYLLLIIPLLLCLTWNYLIDFLSSIPASLFSGTNLSDHSYENGPYQSDMEKAIRLVREEKLDEAITAYREIIQKSPKQCEPRFNLARIYEKVEYPGLALTEYRKVVGFREVLETNHPLILESERAIQELKNLMSVKIVK